MKEKSLNFEKMAEMAVIAKDYEIVFQSLDDVPHDGRTVTMNGRTMKFFGNCDCMGFQEDARVKQAAIDAIQKYGLMLCNSRSYSSSSLYSILEEKMTTIMGSPTFVSRTTSYASLTVLPMVVGAKDAIILDHQVHNSVQMSAGLAAVQGSKITKVSHSNMAQLEEKIIELSKTHEKVWYMFDGVYSMLGDFAPFEAIQALMDKYEQFYAYCDDAWGMSWTGKHGRGMALTKMKMSPKLVLIGSLEKGFGCAGGGTVTLHDELRRNVIRDMGPLQIFSGPLANSVLGSAIAAADIHLSDEIYGIQDKFASRVKLLHDTAKSLNLKLASDDHAPICFIPIGNSEATMFVTQCLKKAGFYANIAIYPLVPNHLAGIRIVVNNYVSQEDIKQLMIVIAESLPIGIEKYKTKEMEQQLANLSLSVAQTA
jgi:7-keto-8-aminopelargonate synthetase-like enzyme